MRLHILVSVVLISSCLAWSATACDEQPEKPGAPRVFLVDGGHLARVKEQAAAGDKSLAAALADLRLLADKDLKAGPFTIVTNNKPKQPPSGDKHDYVSMAPYFWPDPDKKDGLPYIRKDGRVNPEREKFDAPLMLGMSRAVSTLALAYYLTDQEKYAEHAARLLRVWFLDAETRMNPNLKYGQFIPDITDGRGIGIIDTVKLLKVVDAVGMLHGARAWTKADQAGMEGWFRDYLQWLRTSKHGKEESAAANNHGSWYDVQVATFALFVGEKDSVKQVLEESKTKRIARQIEPDGRQPLELKRTKAFDYSRGNLEALFALATLGDRLGIDLWSFETKDGRSIRKALDWLIPFATGEKKWEYQQLKGVQGGSLTSMLRRAAVAYREERYQQLANQLQKSGGANTMLLLYPAWR
jgi:hypothetical protein